MEKYDKEKREKYQIPEKDNISTSTERESSNNNNNPKNCESSSDSDFDIDDERLTLIQVIKIIKNKDKNKKNTTFLNKKRPNHNSCIIYDRLTKKLCDPFVPNYEELKNFLNNCTVSEVNADSPKDIDPQKDSLNNVFDPLEFMKKNNIDKTILSFEDDLCTFPPKKEIDFNCEIEEQLPELSKPLIDPSLLFSSSTPRNESLICSEKEDYAEILKILVTDTLDKRQKKWLSSFINKVAKMPMNEVLVKDKKIEIVFDLDLTCIFSFVNNTNKSEAILYKECFPEKNIHVLNVEFQSKTIFSSVIIRNGLKDFVNYVKDICNFHIRTQGVQPYALKISEILVKYLDIEFQLIKCRESTKNINDTEKSLKDFENEKINNENSIIFDDSLSVWKEAVSNLIPSKKFIDKECGVYSKIEKNKSSLDNELTLMLKSYGPFHYHKFSNTKKPSWKAQSIYNKPLCPFYQYSGANSLDYNLIYYGEYLNSPKLQFVYMENVIKEIYYMMYYLNVPISHAIKLVRLNALNSKLFYLKYLKKEQKEILAEIIKVCGGEIIENDDDCIDFKIKTVFLVCSMEYYVKEEKAIKEELNNNKKYILINEKYILDSYYFMSDLGSCYDDNEYNPQKLLAL